jgi:hypothetical protein
MQAGATTTWTPSSQSTVAGQLTGLLDPNSPLIQQARAAAMDQANARGLQNSSMAATAGDAAAYNVALPIAQADASTYAKAGQYNADEANQFKLADLQAAEQQYGTDVAARTEIQKANIAAASAKYGVDMSSMTSMQIAGIQAASAKYGVDVSSATDIQKANIAADSAKYGVDVGSMTALQQSQLASATSKTVAQIQADSAWATANLTADTQKAVAGMTTQSQQLIAAINADTNKYIANMDSATKLQVQQFSDQNQLLLNTNSNATSAFNQAMANVQAIQNNGAMDANTKSTAIADIFGSLSAQFKVLGSVSGLDLTKDLNFSNTLLNNGTNGTTGAGGAGGNTNSGSGDGTSGNGGGTSGDGTGGE